MPAKIPTRTTQLIKAVIVATSEVPMEAAAAAMLTREKVKKKSEVAPVDFNG